MNKLYAAVWLDIIMKVLIILGSLCWLSIAAFDFNYIEWVADKTFEHFDTAVYTLIGLSALFYFFARDFYLPFLGYSVLPCGSMTQKTPDNADLSVTIKVEPNVNVIYWAAEEGDNIRENPIVAYSQYSNAGVVRTDQNGIAVLRVRTPAAYKVPNRTLAPHVHYRICNNAGMVSRVHTVFVEEKTKIVK